MQLNVTVFLLLSLYFVHTLGFIRLQTGYFDQFKRTQRSLYSDELWIQQPLDHFDSNEQRTWNMRYFENLQYWKPNGPIYLQIGGEGAAYGNNYGIVDSLAYETNGAVYISEHRYYGKSMPVTISSADDFKYLSSEQALADVANLIKTLKRKPQYAYAKVVVVGGSYAGNLAAWAREQYPALVDAALASSGPVLAQVDFYEYYEKITYVFAKYGWQSCVDRTKATFQKFQQLLQTESGIAQFKREENICENVDMSIPINQQTFFYFQVTAYAYMTQYGTPEKVTEKCGNSFTSLIQLNSPDIYKKMVLRERPDGTRCTYPDFQFYVQYIKTLQTAYSWSYQTCTEFGYFTSTSSDNQMFSQTLPVDFYYQMCRALFGSQFGAQRVTQGVAATNRLYGGRTPNVTCVVFTQGDMDPWSTLGVLEDLSPDAPARVTPDVSHCADLRVDSTTPEPLRETQMYVKSMIKKWIGLA